MVDEPDSDKEDAESGEETPELELETPEEPRSKKADLAQRFEEELTPEERMAGPRGDQSVTVPPAVAEAAAEQIEPYLWAQWVEDLPENLDRETFSELVALPQSDAVRWLKEEVSWDYYVQSIVQKLERRDELLEELT